MDCLTFGIASKVDKFGPCSKSARCEIDSTSSPIVCLPNLVIFSDFLFCYLFLFFSGQNGGLDINEILHIDWLEQHCVFCIHTQVYSFIQFDHIVIVNQKL